MPLQEILIEQIQDLYDAEKQLTKALPRMVKAAKHPELKQAFEEHLQVTQGQVQRIERVFEILGEKAKSKPCAAMKGLVEEGREIIAEKQEEMGLKDAALIGAAQKIEHYEISGYGTVRAMAKAIGQSEAAGLLRETEEEEAEADKKLTKIAQQIYKEAGTGSAKPSGGKKAASSRGQNGTSSRGRNGASSRGAQVTTDHDEIRQWAEERGAHPACVRGTGGKQDTGMIRLDFPGYTGEKSLQPITWEEWFEKFDENGLALLHQDKTARGQLSNFNKLISREQDKQTGSKRRR